MSYSSHRDKQIRLQYRTLQQDLTTAFISFKDNPTPSHRTEYVAKKAAFDAILTHMEAKYTFAAKARFQRYGNRSGKLLSSLLRGHHPPPTIITRLKDSSSNSVTSGNAISQILHTFYKDLYARPSADEDARRSFWDKISMPSITADQATSLIKPITSDEVESTIKKLKNNKAPGPDGLSTDFYKLLGPKISTCLADVFNTFLSGLPPPLHFNSALLRVLPKPGRDLELASSYRPISLLNSDYKLFTKILADRLKAVLPTIIHPDQTGFIQGRHSVTNVRKVLAVMHWLSSATPATPHAILSLDAEKAFDLISWEHLFDTLQRFGTPQTFITALRNLYNDSSSQILSNGYISSPFPIQRGTRQGCPLSPLLFAMALEPLAILLRSSTSFRGARVGSREIKLSMFADDMLLFIARPEESLTAIVDILDQFSSFAGFRVNYAKSNLMPLGVDASYFTARPALTRFAVSTSPLKYLGVYIPPSLISLYQTNVHPIFKSIKNSLDNWKDLPLSLSGRIAVIKGILFPKISYVFQMLPLYPTNSDIHLLRSLFSKFAWQGKHPRVAFSKMVLPKEMGGYGMPDVVAYVQSILFRHISDWLLMRSEYSNYDIEAALFAPYSPSALLHSQKSDISGQIAKCALFAGTYRAWLGITKRLQMNPTVSPYTTFWGNPNFTPALDDVNFLRWREKGISAVRDVFDPGGSLLSFSQIRERFGLPARDFYMYLQARHFVSSEISVFGLRCTENAILQTLSLLRTKPYKTKYLYNPLLKPLVQGQWAKSLASWSQDLSLEVTPDLLLNHCSSILRWLPSAAMQETHLKCIQRAYISPARRKHMVQDETGQCRKCGFFDASYFHCFWECGRIKRFWNKLIAFLNATFSFKLTIHPVPCLLLNYTEWDLGAQRHKLRPLISIILTIAKQCILYQWIKKAPPFLHEVKARLLNTIYYDRQKAFPEVERGARWFDQKWSLYTMHLPTHVQEHLQSGFEKTRWYLAGQNH